MKFEMQNQPQAERRVLLAPLIVLAFAAYVPALFADGLPTTPQCGQASLADYLAQGTCGLGDYTLTNFSFSSSGTGDANLLSASQIMVDPVGSTPTSLSVQFSADGGFQVAEGQTAEYIFDFTLDPALPKIAGPVLNLGPNDPVTLSGAFCGDGTIVSAPNVVPVACEGTAGTGIFPATLLIVGDGNPATQSTQFPELVTMLDSRLVLDLTGPASVDSFGWGANVTGGGPSPVPEPSTSLLLVPAFAALAWLRKKRPAGQF